MIAEVTMSPSTSSSSDATITGSSRQHDEGKRNRSSARKERKNWAALLLILVVALIMIVVPVAITQANKRSNGGAEDSWGQQAEFTDVSGREVSISGDAALIGTKIFARDPSSSSWNVQADLDSGLDRYNSVAINGDTAAITYPAYACIFVRDHNNTNYWFLQANLTEFSGMGAVDIDGDIAVFGASFAGPSNSGRVYVYSRQGTVWSLDATLQSPTEFPSGDRFGSSISVSSNTLLVGALNGGFFFFAKENATWYLQHEVLSDTDTFSDIGISIAADFRAVDIDGDTAILAVDSEPFKGVAYIFVWNGMTWSFQAKLHAEYDRDYAFGYGSDVAIYKDTAIVGAQRPASHFDGVSQGGAYIFTREGTTWGEPIKLVPSYFGDNNDDGDDDFEFGVQVAISGDTAIAGSRGARAYAFQSTTTALTLAPSTAPTTPAPVPTAVSQPTGPSPSCRRANADCSFNGQCCSGLCIQSCIGICIQFCS